MLFIPNLDTTFTLSMNESSPKLSTFHWSTLGTDWFISTLEVYLVYTRRKMAIHSLSLFKIRFRKTSSMRIKIRSQRKLVSELILKIIL